MADMWTKRRASPPPRELTARSSPPRQGRPLSSPTTVPRLTRLSVSAPTLFALPSLPRCSKRLSKRLRRLFVIIACATALCTVVYNYERVPVQTTVAAREEATGSLLTFKPLQRRSFRTDGQSVVTRPIIPAAQLVYTKIPLHEIQDDAAKYLAYLPHGSLQTQRIALENALTLSLILQRTLLLPAAWLGLVPPYAPYDTLRETLEITRKGDLTYCDSFKPGVPLPEECHEAFNYTVVHWPFLAEIASVTEDWVDRRDFASDHFTRRVSELGTGIPERKIKEFKETHQLQYRLYDETPADDLKGFSEAVQINYLQGLSGFRVLSFGSLSSTKRLHLTKPENIEIHRRVVGAMRFAQENVVVTADRVARLLGLGYLGADARLKEPWSRWKAGENMRTMFWALARAAGVSDETIGKVEREHWLESAEYRSEVTRNQTEEGYKYSTRAHKHTKVMPYFPLPSRQLDNPSIDYYASDASPLMPQSLNCTGTLHEAPELLPFNTPVYLASDVSNPDSHPALSMIFKAFPCIFTIKSPEIASIINEDILPLQSYDDGTPLAPLLMPLEDAAIAARGRSVHGTKGSSMSRFLNDIEWPSVHGQLYTGNKGKTKVG